MINLETKENLPLLTILVGIQGSGKSTWARDQDNFDNFNVVILSSDALRRQYPDYDNENIFKEIYKRANEYLSKGLDVIIDSTAVTIKSRRKMLSAINVPCIKKALIFNTPYEECKRRLIQRNAINGKTGSHYVPLEVQKKYLESFEVPFLEEGFDYIDIYNKPSLMESNANLFYIDDKTSGFNQNNKHHSQLLGEHMNSTYTYVREYSKDVPLLSASLHHDIGKVFTQTYKEGDPNAHYYNHANVGAYWFLSNVGVYMPEKGLPIEGQLDTYLTQTTLDIVFYINYHMVIYNLKTEKSINKWKKLFGEEKFTNLQLLNKADKSNHADDTV